MENRTLTKEEKFTQNFLLSHVKENDFEERGRSVSLNKVKRYMKWRTITEKKGTPKLK
jgi:hypothetical protein